VSPEAANEVGPGERTRETSTTMPGNATRGIENAIGLGDRKKNEPTATAPNTGELQVRSSGIPTSSKKTTERIAPAVTPGTNTWAM
jgi:hypothetical protein